MEKAMQPMLERTRHMATVGRGPAKVDATNVESSQGRRYPTNVRGGDAPIVDKGDTAIASRIAKDDGWVFHSILTGVVW